MKKQGGKERMNNKCGKNMKYKAIEGNTEEGNVEGRKEWQEKTDRWMERMRYECVEGEMEEENGERKIGK